MSMPKMLGLLISVGILLLLAGCSQENNPLGSAEKKTANSQSLTQNSTAPVDELQLNKQQGDLKDDLLDRRNPRRKRRWRGKRRGRGHHRRRLNPQVRYFSGRDFRGAMVVRRGGDRDLSRIQFNRRARRWRGGGRRWDGNDHRRNSQGRRGRWHRNRWRGRGLDQAGSLVVLDARLTLYEFRNRNRGRGHWRRKGGRKKGGWRRNEDHRRGRRRWGRSASIGGRRRGPSRAQIADLDNWLADNNMWSMLSSDLRPNRNRKRRRRRHKRRRWNGPDGNMVTEQVVKVKAE